METNAKKPKSKPQITENPTEEAALKRLEHDLIKEDGIVPATKGRHAIHCLPLRNCDVQSPRELTCGD